MKDIIITVAEDVVEELQNKNFEVVSMQEIITDLLETHAYDKNDRVVHSPVLVGYQTKLTKVRTEFERLKDKMLASSVDGETLRNVLKWDLDYNSCQLHLLIAD